MLTGRYPDAPDVRSGAPRRNMDPQIAVINERIKDESAFVDELLNEMKGEESSNGRRP